LNINLFLVIKRSVFSRYAVAGLFYVVALTGLLAESRERGNTSRFIPSIESDVAHTRLMSLRQLRWQGDFCWRFKLQHLPRRGDSTVYQGTCWGSWNEQGPVNRFQLFATEAGAAAGLPGVELIIQNGSDAAVWIRQAPATEFKLMDGASLFEPILPGVLYTPFDLQMPYIYWNAYSYQGAARVLSRVAQWFRMLPPKASAAAQQVQAVRIAVDDSYDALLKVEVYGMDGELRSDFKVESFKQVQRQYIIKQITLKDYRSRDRTRFQVVAASMSLSLDPSIFNPQRQQPVPILADELFEVL